MYLSKVSFLDVMAYTAISAIGFELIEAFIYLFSTNVPQVLMRGVTSMHPAFGLVMGYIVAKGINIYNFFFMTKARKKAYYTEPLFPAEAEAAEAEAAERV